MGPAEAIILLLFILLFIAIPVTCAIAAMTIAAGKGRDTTGEKVGWFLLGLFFPVIGPVIGLIVALIIGPKQTIT